MDVAYCEPALLAEKAPCRVCDQVFDSNLATVDAGERQTAALLPGGFDVDGQRFVLDLAAQHHAVRIVRAGKAFPAL